MVNPARALWLILPFVLLVGLVTMPAEEYPGDPVAVRCEAVCLINTGSLNVPPSVVAESHSGKGQYFFENSATNQQYSKWGIVNTLINVPPLLIEKWWVGALPYYATSKRILLLNLFNVGFAMACAYYLTLIVSRYTSSFWTILIYVLSAIYCTFLWNYLRAQTSEIYQTLLLLACYHYLVSWLASPQTKRHLGGVGVCLGLLILVKTVYVILPFVVAALLIYARVTREGLSIWLALSSFLRDLSGKLRWFAVPVFVSIILLLGVDAYKFGSPFITGFEQWGQEEKPALFLGHPARPLPDAL